jgi:hypothetical protein
VSVRAQYSLNLSDKIIAATAIERNVVLMIGANPKSNMSASSRLRRAVGVSCVRSD